MTNRREFLQISAATAVPLPAFAAAASPAAAADPAYAPLYKLVFDRRFAESAAFGAEAARLGATPHVIAGDVTGLWYDDLYHRWKDGPVAVAGLTAQGPLFCLETLARDAGLRLLFRAEHASLPGGRVSHSIEGPKSVVDAAQALLEGKGSDWGAAMAALVMRLPVGGPRASTIFTTAANSAARPDAEALITWALAPTA
jgi:hypothetical protein